MKDYYFRYHGDIYEVIDSHSIKAAKQRVANTIWSQYGDDPDETIKKLKIATNADYERNQHSAHGAIYTI